MSTRYKQTNTNTTPTIPCRFASVVSVYFHCPWSCIFHPSNVVLVSYGSTFFPKSSDNFSVTLSFSSI